MKPHDTGRFLAKFLAIAAAAVLALTALIGGALYKVQEAELCRDNVITGCSR